MTRSSIEQYSSFVLAQDLNRVIAKGMVDVVLEDYDPDHFEVEFLKSDGTNHEFEGQVTFTIDRSFIEGADDR